MNRLRIIISVVLILVIMVIPAGCESSAENETDEPKEETELKTGNSMDYARDVFTQEEILDLYERYKYELEYIVTYLKDANGSMVFNIAITHDLTQVSVDYSDTLNPDFMYDYVDCGFEEDNEFERSLRAVLVEGELGFLRCFRDVSVVFGRKLTLQYHYREYDLETVKKRFGTNNPDAIGQIDNHWYYYAYDPEFTTGNSYVDRTRGYLSKEEIKEIYFRRKHEFNYVARYLCAKDAPIYYIVILNNYEDVMMSEWTLTYWNGYIPYTDMGYEKDEEFERCLKVILVEEGMGHIYFIGASSFNRNVRIYFSGYDPIQYISKLYDTEEQRLVKPNNYFGRIEGNWYFYVQALI